ncbi:MAG: hypothetical protein FJ104_14735 [Deltaproteobacteria bacterium]|nr:hypothetical protein [Deltaproteobacteria bacterium]
MRRAFLPLLASVLASVALAPRAHACGLTPPIGPNGLPTVCHGDRAVGVRAGLTAGGTATRIVFPGGRASLEQGAVAATLDLSFGSRFGVSAAAGSSAGGSVSYAGSRYDLLPGPLGGLGVSYRWFGDGVPFVHTSFTLALARSTARAPGGAESSFLSRDYRLGLAMGHAIGKVAAPFVVARYFGAGTSWEPGGGVGADAFRYHVGVGSAFGFGEHLDALVEVLPLGERRVSVGAGYTF